MANIIDYEYDSNENLVAITVEDDGDIFEMERVWRGTWEDDPYFWKCNQCDKWLSLEEGNADMNYCPNCGARMN